MKRHGSARWLRRRANQEDTVGTMAGSDCCEGFMGNGLFSVDGYDWLRQISRYHGHVLGRGHEAPVWASAGHL